MTSYFQIDASDNTAVLLTDAHEGEVLTVLANSGVQNIRLNEAISYPHKVALVDIPQRAASSSMAFRLAGPQKTSKPETGSTCITWPAATTSVQSPWIFSPVCRQIWCTNRRKDHDPTAPTWQGYLRDDGRKGIRNLVLVIYTVECASHVAPLIARNEPETHVIGFPGCTDNQYAIRLLLALARHPNVGAVLVVGLGCEYTQQSKIADVVRQSGREAEWFTIQDAGGTTRSAERGYDHSLGCRRKKTKKSPRFWRPPYHQLFEAGNQSRSCCADE